MKLRNKKTGGVIEIDVERSRLKFRRLDDKTKTISFGSLAELNEEWEDYEEPKGYFTKIRWEGDKIVLEYDDNKVAGEDYEKLKALKRLKDKGFRFESWETWEKVTRLACFDKGIAHSYYAGFTFRSEDRLEKDSQVKADLDLLFGGEE